MTMANINQTILDAFRSRYACKGYDPEKKVSAQDFDTILEVAHLSPSSFGFEPWKILILEDPKIKEKLAPIAWGARNSLNGASHFVILLARKKIDTLNSSDYITHIMKDIQKLPDEIIATRRETFKNFQENDFDLLESDRAIFDWACKQTYIVLANMLTTAALLGIDSCPIEGFDRAAVNTLLATENIIDPDHFGVSVMVSFGYGNKPPHQKTRQPLSDVVIRK
ncbi:NADPH nitroreductase [Acetobacterium woodii DSM 1030]|uniref:NADPH nitroreductase n=2 Tax=Acetobacterium woodii TaxID=33952 RepID=H6LK71_ACEWD|nr:NADPH nitroreductase [Acetobacterium woodii DSM 1030]